MKIFVLVILLVAVAYAAIAPLDIPSPGLTGMNSTYDVDALEPTDARFLKNAALDNKTGAIENRFGLVSIGDTAGSYFSAGSLYDDRYRSKLLVGVFNQADLISGPTNSADSVSATYTIGSAAWQIMASDLNRTNIRDTGLSPVFCVYPGDHIRWTKWDNTLLLTDGQNGPWMISAQKANFRDYLSQDTIVQGRRVLPLSLEAPGQLRPMVINQHGPLNGNYRYRYHFISGPTIEGPSIESRYVSADSQMVAITLFEGQPFSAGTETDNIGLNRVILERQKELGAWVAIDSFRFWSDSSMVYLDTLADAASNVPGLTALLRFSTLGNAPGAFWNLTVYDTMPLTQLAAHGTQTRLMDSSVCSETVWVRYSYYDPVTGMESGLGPSRPVYNPCDTTTTNLRWALMKKGFTKISERPTMIRYYRSLPSDTSLWFAVAQLSTNHLTLPFADDSNVTQYTVAPAFRDEVEVEAGENSYAYPHVIDDSIAQPLPYHAEDQQPISAEGEAIQRPPFVLGLSFPLSDMAVFAGRLWGIGDPMYRQRLYYSAYDQPSEWATTDYLSLDEQDNDELVALAKPDEGDYLFAFKHKKIFIVTGYDPAYDLQYQTVSSRHGAVNANCVVNVSPAVYFLNKDLNVYRLTTGSLDTVSTKVTSSIRALFPNFSDATNYARMMVFNDEIILTNTNTGEALEYNCNEQAWQWFESGTRKPAFTLSYDSTGGTLATSGPGSGGGRGAGPGGAAALDTAQTSSGDWLGFIGGGWFAQEGYPRQGFDRYGSSLAPTIFYTFSYQTPFIGDGENLYEIQSITLTGSASGGNELRADIIDGQGAVLAQSRLNYAPPASDVVFTYKLGFAPNAGRYLSVRLHVDSTASRITLSHVTINQRRVSREVTQ